MARKGESNKETRLKPNIWLDHMVNVLNCGKIFTGIVSGVYKTLVYLNTGMSRSRHACPYLPSCLPSWGSQDVDWLGQFLCLLLIVFMVENVGSHVCVHKEGHHFLYKWFQSGNICFRHQSPKDNTSDHYFTSLQGCCFSVFFSLQSRCRHNNFECSISFSLCNKMSHI